MPPCLAQLQVAPSSPWHSWTYSYIAHLCFHLHTAFFSVSSALLIGFRTHPNPGWPHLTLTNHIYEAAVSKQSHILRFQVDMNFQRTLIQPIHSPPISKVHYIQFLVFFVFIFASSTCSILILLLTTALWEIFLTHLPPDLPPH